MMPCPVCGEKWMSGDVFYRDSDTGRWFHSGCAKKGGSQMTGIQVHAGKDAGPATRNVQPNAPRQAAP